MSNATKELRQCLMFGLIGKPKSGKSYLLQQTVLELLIQKQRVFIIDPDGAETSWDEHGFKRYDDISDVPDNFKGAVIVPYSDDETFGTPTFPYIQSKLDPRLNGGSIGPWSNSTFVLDDSSIYAQGSLKPELKWLLGRKRQVGCDIIATAHSWGLMCPDFMRFIDVYAIGVTNGSPQERSDVIKGDALKRTVAVRNQVNEARRTGQSKFPWKFIDRDGFPFKGEI